MIYGSMLLAPAAYSTKTCATCGKEFECPVQTRYKTSRQGGYNYYCGYSCFREEDKRREARLKEAVARQNEYDIARSQHNWHYISATESPETQEKHLVLRIQLCEEKMRGYRAKYDAAETKAQRDSSRKHVREWEKKKEMAEKQLKTLRRR